MDSTPKTMFPPSGTVYRVGGCVRDAMLGRPIRDHDHVIVGIDERAMLDAGFLRVGKSFPVFLHPRTREEYALPRCGWVDGAPPQGASPASVSLAEDLARRDLTINAMAEDLEGRLVDPHGGSADLASRTLRHVGPAFAEDPLRILRTARLAAELAPWGFAVAPETSRLMSDMVASGALVGLPPERVWGEFVKVASSPQPSRFLQVLRTVGALAVLAPEVDALYGVPQVATHHPEVDTGVHVEMVMDQAARLSPGDAGVLFAALTHDLGKALTPGDILPQHLGHEEAGLPPLEALAARWSPPVDTVLLARAVCSRHLVAHRACEIRPGTLLSLLEAVDAFRNPARFERFVRACEADARGRLGLEDRSYPQADHLRAVLVAASAARVPPEIVERKSGPAVGAALRDERLRAIHALQGPVRKAEASAAKKKHSPG